MPSINVASFRRGSRDNFFFNGPLSKKNRTPKIIATQKCLNTFTGYFLYLKVVTNEKGEAVGEVVTIIC